MGLHPSGSAFAQAAFSAYNYNDRSELITSDRYLGTDISDTSTPVSDQQRSYDYDPIGNRRQATAADIVTSYTANALNQYTRVDGPAAYTPAYDADGNLQTAPDGMRYTYNAENRLIAAQPENPVDGDTRVAFTYDYMGRRGLKVVYGYSGGQWVQNKEIRFVYDGWNLVKETTLSGSATSVDRYYVWGLDLSQSLQGAGGVGGLLAAINGSLTYHYLFDANGNVGQVVDSADGTVAAHYEYDPFGKVIFSAGDYAEENFYRFSTKYFDSETGLYYYGYRYYSAELGRWINRDPSEESGGINLYTLTNNDAINSIDLLGLWKLVKKGSWDPTDWFMVQLDFMALKNEVPYLLFEIDEGLKKAEKILECCVYKEILIEKLLLIKDIVTEIDLGLKNSKKLVIRKDNWVTNTGAIADIGYTAFFLHRDIRLNTNHQTSYFNRPINKRKGSIFHELSHIYGTHHTGSDFFKDADFLTLMVTDSWRNTVKTIRNRVVKLSKEENKSCLKNLWPDN